MEGSRLPIEQTCISHLLQDRLAADAINRRRFFCISADTARHQSQRKLHNLSHDGPRDTLKWKVFELEKKKKRRNHKKGQIYVDVPESKAWLDTATMPVILTAVGTALFAKILLMIDESNAQERLERKIKNAPEGQGTVWMLTREEWDKIRDLRPRTPFESSIARPNAKIRTGEPLHMEDVKDWTLDVLTDGLTRAEETAKRGST